MRKLLLLGLVMGLFVACGDKGEENKDSNVESKVESSLDSNDKSAESTQKEADSNIESTQTQSATSEDSTPKADLDTNSTSKQDTNSQATATQTANVPQDLYKKCIACHGVKGDKVAPGSVGNVLIAKLSKAQIVESLKGYRAKTLNKGGAAASMYLQAINLSDEDIKILGDYISSMK